EQLVMYGGTSGGVNELTLDGPPTWTLLSGTPRGRFAASAIYDSLGDRMVVFGGYHWLGPDLSETLVRDFGTSDQWATLPLAPPVPTPRSDHTAIYDPGGQRMIIFGGSGGSAGLLNDTWS